MAVEKHLLFLQNSVRKALQATKNCIISCFFLFIGFEHPTLLSTEFRQAWFWTGISYSRVARSSGITMHCLVFDFIAIFTLHNAVFHYSKRSKFTPPESNYHQLSHQKTTPLGGKTTFSKNNNPKRPFGNAWKSVEQNVYQKKSIQIIWLFPKIGVPQNGVVKIMENPIKMGWFRKHPYRSNQQQIGLFQPHELCQLAELFVASVASIIFFPMFQLARHCWSQCPEG